MDELILKGVRCFKDETRLPLRPITVLVGENSSGKSTLLASIRLAWALNRGLVVPPFNAEPFNLGAYDDIAHVGGGRAKHPESFRLGMRFRIGTKGESVNVEGVFASRAGQPDLQEWSLYTDPDIDGGGQRITLAFKEGDDWEVSWADGTGRHEMGVAKGLPRNFLGDNFLHWPAPAGGFERYQRWLVEGWTRLVRIRATRVLALAPIRSRPERTYDPVRDDPTPEGGHVPMALASRHLSDAAGWRRLHAELVRFGKSSGMFRDLDVSRLAEKGRQPGPADPFKIQVTLGKAPFNLIDVGYGVNQVLPLLVDALLQPEGTTFLAQQPEVHLHPKAQAELGSALGRISVDRKQRFVIETHSDYLVDRLRMDVRHGALRAEDLLIVWCERTNGVAHVHPMHVDPEGNLLDAPPKYGEFFIDHQLGLIGAR